MPTLLHASMSSVPAGTASFLPSTVMFTSATKKSLFANRCSPFAQPPTPESAKSEKRIANCVLSHQCQLVRFLVRARLSVEMIFKFFPVLLHVRNDGHRCRIAQRAKRPPQHVFRQILQVVDVLGHAAPRVKASERLLDPVCFFAAGNAPSAAFVLVKIDHPQREPHTPHRVT